MKEKR